MTWTDEEVWRLESAKTGKVWVRTTLKSTDFKDSDGKPLPDDNEPYTARLTPCP